jgi:hypothetical protein
MSFNPTNFFPEGFFPENFLPEGESGSDTTPDQFSFVDQSGIALGATVTSAAVTIAGIDEAVLAIATGGTIDVNGDGSFQASRSVNSGDQIRARHTAGAGYSAITDTVVSINGVSDTFSSLTIPDPDAKRSTFTRLGFGFG